MTAPTLTEFLLARIAEDRVIAVESQRDPWRVGHTSSCDYPGDMPGYCSCDATARVLAECKAKRRIIEDHSTVHAGCPGSPTLTSDDGEQDGTYGGPCAVLRNLASVYADHPSYREAWRP